MFAISPLTSSAQVDISGSCGAPTVIDFAGFTGAGFDPTPTAGQLNSNTWSTAGFGTSVPFGGSENGGDAARGTTDGSGVGTGGVYNYSGGNGALWVQPGGSDFTPGDLTLKACNNTMSVMADVEVSYDILFLNDQARANSLNFAYSPDDLAYTSVPALDFITPEAPDALGVQTVSRSTTLTGVNLMSGACIFLQWQGDDETGGGSRDEYGIDNVSLCASGAMPPPPPPSANPTCIASDDFDSPTKLLSRTVTVDMAFVNIGDLFGIGSSFSGNPNFAPFALIDDGNIACANYFPFDNQGVIPCDYGNQFFGMVDTENPNNMGPVSAEWVFDISTAANLTSISMDMSAMGDFESNDDFTWSYSIDGGPYTTIFAMTADESTNATYTLENGNTRTLNDPMTVNGTILLNHLTNFSAPISGAGSQLTLRLEGMGNGGTEAIAWDNIKISGVKIGAAVVPTMGEWAMFLFALIMISIGIVFVFNAQQRLAMGGTNNVSSSFGIRQFPFEAGTFKVALKHAFGLALAGFAFIFFAWGEIVPADLIGMALAIPLVAYLIHLVKLFGEE